MSKLLLGPCLLMALAASIIAQPVPGVLLSLESLASGSDLIVRGSVYAALDPAQKPWGGYKVVVRVKETLKGEPQKEIVFPGFLSSGKPLSRPDAIVFLSRAERLYRDPGEAFPHEYVAFKDVGELGSVLLEGPGPHFMTMAMEPLYKREDILKRLKAAIKAAGSKKDERTWHFLLPGALELPPNNGTGLGVLLAVPADKRLEKLAREWMRSKDEVLQRLGKEAIAFLRAQDKDAPSNGK